MNLKLPAALLLLAATSVLPAHSACPAPLAGDTPEVIEANQQRLICLQRELSEKADQHSVTVQIDNLDRKLDHLQLQQRFDALDFSVPTTPNF